MITEIELRRSAASAGVDLMVQDLDYSLGWFLAGFFSQTNVTNALIFKGGTCLRKCYFANYRFSEDLDFTLTRLWSLSDLAAAVETVRAWSVDMGGPDFDVQPPRLEVVNDEYGQESFQARVYYRGPLRWGGSPRSIQIDISRGEHLEFATEARRLHHPYSDEMDLPEVYIPCYNLEEMLAEKLRAIGGQRRFAVSRDLYDIYHLLRAGVSLEKVRPALQAKFAAKGLDLSSMQVERLIARQSLFAADWRRHLVHLLPLDQQVSFEVVWQAITQLMADLQRAA